MVRFLRNSRKPILMAGDVGAVLLANLLAVMLRFEFDWQAMVAPGHRNLELVLLDLVITPCVFVVSGLYKGYWKYAGLDDLLRLVRAVSYRTIALIVTFYAFSLYGLSRAVVIISSVLLLLFAGLLRLLPRFYLEFFSSRRRSSGRRTLIVGAGDTGESLLRELKKSPHLELNPVGFIDSDPEKAGVEIHGVRVLGNRGDLERLIEANGIREVILAIPGASGRDLREIFEVCRRMGVRFRTVPTRGELARGAARVSQIRLVDVEDLLGRQTVNLDQEVLRQGLTGLCILVTGAAGSIGRELARQIAAYGPRDLILLDRNENSLFHLEAELREAHPLDTIHCILGDVADRRRMQEVFETARPQLIFHAAAYKHVPLMEENPLEAIKNNVVATQGLLEIAAESGAERFIYISTDKAVHPTSMMGATKRLGERLVKSTAGATTRFMTVRFGNVLGSDGSVVPTFRRQIAAGGPVTVTHPEATRYFMTIPEAVQLVMMAGVMGEGGETFLLQMGEPIRIVEMARNMIELSGLRPDEDISIVFTGLRPGEKLHEELRGSSEQALPTSNEKILALVGVEPFDAEEWRTFRDLERVAANGQMIDACALLKRLVKDYTPQGVASAPYPVGASKIVGIGARRRLDAPA